MIESNISNLLRMFSRPLWPSNMRKPSAASGVLAATLLATATMLHAATLGAQPDSRRALPLHFPLNPTAVARTPLGAQPFLSPVEGWAYSLAVDYGSAIEWEESAQGGKYVLDAELMRVHLDFRRHLSTRTFVQLGIDVNSVLNGFADAAFDWYHGAVGVPFRGREQRPLNSYLYEVRLPTGEVLHPERPDAFLGDVRTAYGITHSSRHQSRIIATFPTATGPDGYSRKTVSVGVTHTMRTDPERTFAVEGSLGFAYTPARGALAAYQEELMNSASFSANLKLSQNNSFYGVLYSHSGLYSGTTLPELEQRELTIDFGWQRRTSSGHVWRLGATEDFGPSDAGLDLTLRFGWSWH